MSGPIRRVPRRRVASASRAVRPRPGSTPPGPKRACERARIRRLRAWTTRSSRSQALVASFEALVPSPAGVELFDAHVHLGVDIDGMRGDLEELLRIQQAHRITRSFMFCLDEPDRQPGFRAPNDRTLAYAEARAGS